jgi:alkanesulfonate monooxygenase
MERAMPIRFSVDISGFDLLDAARGQGRLDRTALGDLAGAAEAAGIDRLVLANPERGQDLATLAAWIVHATSSLGVEIEHRAGSIEPEIAARQIATLDQLSGGRLTVKVTPPAGEGLSHEESFARLDEYLVLLKRLWSNDSPLDHEGRFFRLRAAFSAVKPFNGASVPLALGGASGTALQVAARHAETFTLPSLGVEEARQVIERVRSAATAYGRRKAIRFVLPLGVPNATVDEQGDGDAPANISIAMPSGTPARIASELGAYLDAGVTDLAAVGLRFAGELSAFGATCVRPVRAALGQPDDTGRLGSPAANIVFGRWSRYSR